MIRLKNKLYKMKKVILLHHKSKIMRINWNVQLLYKL
jgi:hypothetical protein